MQKGRDEHKVKKQNGMSMIIIKVHLRSPEPRK